MTVIVPEKKCLACGFVMSPEINAKSADKIPHPGSYALCEKCGEILRYDDNYILRVATELEISWLQDYQRRLLLAGQHFIREKVTT